jgi:hypothetical protein
MEIEGQDSLLRAILPLEKTNCQSTGFGNFPFNTEKSKVQALGLTCPLFFGINFNPSLVPK